MDMGSCIRFKLTCYLVFLSYFTFIGVNCYLFKSKDCRTQDKGPFYFKKVNSKTYKCVQDGPVFRCPYKWAIPEWYKYGSTDPCVCKEIPRPGYSDGTKVCPNDPMAGARTTSNPVTAVPPPGTIGDMGCPHPFQRFPNTLRLYNVTNAEVRELPITSELGFLTAENECKYHCLALGTCAAVTYSEVDGHPKCVAFFTMASHYDFRLTGVHHSYFEKVWCVANSGPFLPTPPPIQDGLMIQNAFQTDGSVGIVMLTGVSELSCYTWCYFEPNCAAVDFNKNTTSCTYYTSTSCDSHEPSFDKCCNHYKKKIKECL